MASATSTDPRKAVAIAVSRSYSHTAFGVLIQSPVGKSLLTVCCVSLSGRDMVSKVPGVPRSTCAPCRVHQLSLQMATARAGVCSLYCQNLGSEKRSVNTKHFPCVYRYLQLNQSVREIQCSFFFFLHKCLKPASWVA